MAKTRANSDLPPNVPRILKVLEPAAGQYVVIVKLDSVMASKFPKKPFGTKISEIGLAQKDADLYPGYTLVSIEPAETMGRELIWIFQNLNTSAPWTTKEASRESVVPTKFRNLVSRTKTMKEVDGETLPSAPSGNLIASVVEQDQNSGKALLTTMEEVVANNGGSLVSKRNYVEKTTATVTETFSTGSQTADAGLFVSQSEVSALGSGATLKETVSVDSWPVHVSSDWDPQLGTQVVSMETYVAPPSSTSDAALTASNVSFKPINKDRALKVTRLTPTAALDAFHHVFPTYATVNLPDTLTNVQVIATRTVGNSNSIRYGSSYSVSNGSQVAVTADVNYKLESGFSGSVPAEVHVFYLQGNASSASILSKVNAIAWPQYKPVSERIVISGHGCSKSYTESAGEGGGGLSEEGSVTAFVNAISLPPSLHGALSIQITYNDLTAPTGLANTIVSNVTAARTRYINFLTASKNAGKKMFGYDTTTAAGKTAVEAIITNYNANVSIAVDMNATSFPITVSPSTLTATTPSFVVSGRYLKESTVRDYDYGYVQVTAVVVTI